VPGYDLLLELGRGGMGVVYRAQHLALKRIVALKMILAGAGADDEDLARFRAEAEAVARLQHPNIVQIYEVGQHDGRPYCALEYVDGGSLAEKVAHTPQPARYAAALVQALARAVHHAHQQGIIHRDLKPANVLLTQQGTPKVTDFGLAKRLDDDSGRTRSGAILGTPSYMAPEQAAGQTKEIGPLADVYALGAILYELLTGRPPFQGATLWETLEQVRHREPVSPRQLNPAVPRDLETVCLKCLQKEPHKRYANAEELADDLRRFLGGEPIRARSVGRLERGWRWCRRNRIVAGLSAALLTVLFVGAVVASVAAVRFYRLASSEQQAKDEALQREENEAEARKDAERKGNDYRRSLSGQYVASGTQAQDASDYSLALLWFARALELDRGDSEREPAHRLRLANTWRQMPRLVGVYGHAAPVSWAEMSADSRRVVTASYDGTARVWDVATGEPVGRPMAHPGFVFCARFSPDGKKVATAGGDGAVRLWNASSGEALQPPLEHAQGVYSLVFSPGGRKLAAGCADPAVIQGLPPGVDPYDTRRLLRTPRPGKPGAAIWDVESGTSLTLPVDPMVLCLAFTADGRRLAVVGKDMFSASVYDSTSGRLIAGPFRHQRSEGASGIVEFVSLNDKGNLLVTGDYTGGSHLWDVDTGKELIPWMSGKRGFVEPGGKMVVGRGVWNVATGQGGFNLGEKQRSEMDEVTDASLSSDTWTVLARTKAGVRVWDAQSSFTALTPVLRAPSHKQSARLGQEGRYILVPSQDNICRLWDVAAAAPVLPPLGTAGRCACYSPDGQRVVTGEYSRATLWDAATGRPALEQTPRHPGIVRATDVNPDGRLVLTGSSNGEARLWDATTGQPSGPALVHDFPVEVCFFDRSGNRIVTLEAEDPTARFVLRRVHVWDAHTRRQLWQGERVVDSLHLTLSPDGRWLAAAANDSARVWDMATGQPITLELKHQYWVQCPVFSPDGQLLATCGGDSLARVWELPSGRQRLAIPHASPVSAATFSPDGKSLATGDREGRVRLWSPVTGEALSPELDHDSEVDGLAFGPQGRWLLAVCTSSVMVQAWDTATGDKLGAPWKGIWVPRVVFRSDGRQVLLPAWNMSPQLWDFTTDERSPDEWLLLAQVQSGCRIDPSGAVIRLTPTEIRQSWDELRRRVPAETVLPREQVRSWYWREIRHLQGRGHLADALVRLQQAVAEFPDDLDLLFSRGLNASWVKHYDQALEDLQRVAQRRPAVWRDVADVYNLAHRRAQGLSQLSQAIQADAGNDQLLAARGSLYFYDRQWEKAISDLTAACERGADEQGAMVFLRGRARAELGQWTAACEDLRAALEKQPDNADRQYYYAFALLEANDLAKFQEEVGSAGMARWRRAAVDPGSANSAAWIAVLTPHGDATQALRLIEKVVPEESWKSSYLNTYGLVLYRLGRYKEAAEKVRAGMQGENAKGSVWDWLVLTLACQKQNQPDEARRWFAQVETWLAQPPEKRLKSGNRPLDWDDRLEVEILRREAAALLKP
jgi:WD40 repeat protein/tetratricopeptide (TPR) repeat protein